MSERELLLAVVLATVVVGIVLGGSVFVGDPAGIASTGGSGDDRAEGGTIGAASVDDGAHAVGETERISTHTIGTGDQETTVYVIEGDEPGPTAVVVGGVHGDEPAGFETARDVTGWEIDAGTLVVVPEASPISVEDGTRTTHSGEPDEHDFNRQFPTGEEPETDHARALWNELESHDPDVVMDLHSSDGIYDSDVGGGSKVGQAIFPTATGDAPEHSDAVVSALNERHVSDSLAPVYDFEQGNDLDGSRPLLVHKVAADLETSGYLVETTKHRTDLETRVEWTKAIVSKLLDRHGLLAEHEPGAVAPAEP